MTKISYNVSPHDDEIISAIMYNMMHRMEYVRNETEVAKLKRFCKILIKEYVFGEE